MSNNPISLNRARLNGTTRHVFQYLFIIQRTHLVLLYVVVLIGNICMVINASINFLIYLYLNSSKKFKLVHFWMPLINNTLLSTINVNQPATGLQHTACKEAPLPVKGTNDIVPSVVPNAPVAYNLTLPSKILNDKEGFKGRKRSARKTSHFEAEWV